MRKWYQRSRKRDGWVERKRWFQKVFTAVPKNRELAPARQMPKLAAEKAASE